MRFLNNIISKLNKNKAELLKVFGLFFAWRIIVWIIAFLSKNRLSLGKDQAYDWIKDQSWIINLPEILAYHVRWDSGWYFSIANRGYYFNGFDVPSNVVFFPLYPLLMKVIGTLILNQYLIAGIIISSLALLGSCFFLYALSKIEFGRKTTALNVVFFLLIFPYSFFLISVYSEAVFLLTVVASFYFARKKKWLLSGIFAAFSSAARPTGIIIFIVLLFEYLEDKKFDWKKIKTDILPIFLSPLGLVSYMTYLYFKFGDPFLFSTAQNYWGRKTIISISGFTKTFGSYLHDLYSFNFENGPYFVANALDFITFVVFFTLAIIVFLKIRKSYGLFMILSLIIPAMTQSYISMGRFCAVLFPAFMFFSKISRRQPWGYALIMLFLMLSTLVILMFVNYYWVG